MKVDVGYDDKNLSKTGRVSVSNGGNRYFIACINAKRICSIIRKCEYQPMV